MNSENKNLILAIGLSVAVLIGWNYFYGQPQLDKTRQTQQAQTQPAQPGAPAQPAAATQPGAAPQGQQAVIVQRPRDEALAASKRVKLETPALSGSIALRGALVDDVKLKAYRETVDPKSPAITLFSPPGSAGAYWADMGFVPAAGQTVKLPSRDTEWTADSDTLTPAKPVTLSWDNGEGVVFRRQISADDRYMLTVKDTVENKGAQAISLHPYALVARQGKPHVDGYAVLHEGLVGVVGDSRVQEFTYDAIDKESGQKKTWKGEGGWVGMTDKYWASAVIPDQKTTAEGRFSSFGATQKTYQADMLQDARAVAPGATVEIVNRLFAGAKETDTIDRYQSSLSIRNFDLMIDWGWFYFITKPLFKLIDLIYKVVGNFGIAILAVTLIVKLVFFPLANKSYVSMAKMKAVQPEMESIRTRFAEDKAKQQQELMELYKREKINPVAGCLPMLIQIPVFFALYKVIFITIEMRHAPFFGWIHDLSAPDPTSIFNLFGLIPFAVPGFLMIGAWPILMGISMFFQMKMNPEPADPVQKTMFAWMPVIFTFMLGTFPAGLVIYWTWNNILSVAQQGYIMHRQGVKIELWGNLRKTFGRKSGAAAG